MQKICKRSNGPVTFEPITFQFTPSEGRTGLDPAMIEQLRGKTPLQCYQVIMSDNILEFIVNQTNEYAKEVIDAFRRQNNNQLSYRLKQWTPLTVPMFKVFLGITIWTGLCKYPRMNDYWSQNPLFKNDVSKLMSRNKYELIMRMLHFGNKKPRGQVV